LRVIKKRRRMSKGHRGIPTDKVTDFREIIASEGFGFSIQGVAATGCRGHHP